MDVFVELMAVFQVPYGRTKPCPNSHRKSIQILTTPFPNLEDKALPGNKPQLSLTLDISHLLKKQQYQTIL